ncbi:MAG: DUF3473 domain-containing protein [bacterium]|nr:DUF3473 domain-containing protein [bacterium]
MRHGFSIDVEDWYQVENLAPYVPRSTWCQRESRVERNTAVLLELLDQQSTRATCFVLGDVARRFPNLVRSIAAAGHEVASHGEDHRLVYDLTPAEFRSSVCDLRMYLEDLAGAPVCGYRAPCFSIVKRSWWALDILAECGYTYDASVFPFQRGRYGVAGAPLDPHRLPLTGNLSINEIPPSVLPLGGRPLPIAGGGYFRLYPYQMSRWAIRRLERAGRTYFFYMHPWEIDQDQPRISGMGWKAKFLHTHHLDQMHSRVRSLLSDFQFTTYANIIADRPFHSSKPKERA